MNNNNSLRELESIFHWAKSSIARDLPHCPKILLDLLIIEMRSLWPNRAQRDLMRTFLPEILRGTGIFFVEDSTKLTNVDSTDPTTRRNNWNDHKH